MAFKGEMAYFSLENYTDFFSILLNLEKIQLCQIGPFCSRCSAEHE